MEISVEFECMRQTELNKMSQRNPYLDSTFNEKIICFVRRIPVIRCKKDETSFLHDDKDGLNNKSTFTIMFVVSEEGKNRKSLISHKGSGKRRSNPEDLKMTKDMMREIRYSRTG